jgi:hypothetical protein
MNGYPYLDVKVSIVKGTATYAETTTKFERPGSRLMQMKVSTVLRNKIYVNYYTECWGKKN